MSDRFVDLGACMRDAFEMADKLRRIGPYVNDGSGWRRPTFQESFGMIYNPKHIKQLEFSKDPVLKRIIGIRP